MVTTLNQAKPGFYRLASRGYRPLTGVLFVTGKKVKLRSYDKGFTELYVLEADGTKSSLTSTFKVEEVSKADGFNAIFDNSAS